MTKAQARYNNKYLEDESPYAGQGDSYQWLDDLENDESQ